MIFHYIFTTPSLSIHLLMVSISWLQIMLWWTQRSVYLLKLVFFFPSEKYPEVKFLYYMVVLFGVLKKNSGLFSIVPIPTYIPSTVHSSVQSLSRVRLIATPWIAARQASLSITSSQSSLRLTSIESVMTSSHLILSSPSPPAPNPSQHQSLFQWVNSSHKVAKVLELQL